MSDAIELQPVKGTRDFYPEDMRLRSWLFGHWREIARRYGFEEIDACVLEHEALYIRKAGDEITRQLYNFEDKGSRRVALRPELTPSLARMVMARGAALPLPARWFAIPQCFRYEETQRGRKREHFQWNMDIVGLESVAAEAELMSAQADFLRAAGFKLLPGSSEVVWRVSDRRVLAGVLESMGFTGERFAQVCVIVDKRDKIGREATATMLAQAGMGTADAGRILDLLEITGIDDAERAVGADNPGVASLRRLLELADAAGIAHCMRIDLSVIRGLSYYTGTVWEIFAAAGTFQRAIAGGGRYDRLMEVFGGAPTPMVGFGFGDIPIAELMQELGIMPSFGRGLEDVVYPMGEGQFALATRIARHLRGQGRSVVVDYSLRRFKHVVARAEQDGAKRLVILGGDEVKRGVAKIRTLGGDRTEGDEPLANLGG